VGACTPTALYVASPLAGSAPTPDLHSLPVPTPELRPRVAGQRRGRVAEGVREKGHRRLALGTPLHRRRRKREAAGAYARATHARARVCVCGGGVGA